MSKFIKELVDRSDLQVILVTHSDVFGEYADQVYHFQQKGGVTIAKQEGD